MIADADYFLTTANEFKPLAEPRSCKIQHRLRLRDGDPYQIVRIFPPAVLVEGTAPAHYLVLSPRYEGVNLDAITSWPAFVYVSRIVDQSILRSASFVPGQIELLAWGRIYPTLDEAKQDAVQFVPPRASGRFFAPEVHFLGEQDGPPEQLLKSHLISLLDCHPSIGKAFLARVDYGPDTNPAVALCLRSVFAKPDKRLVREIGKLFASIFNRKQALDILFVDEDQERALSKVCTPFFVRWTSRRT
jgi:hypothetical protein